MFEAGMHKRWRFEKPVDPQGDCSAALGNELGIDPLVARLLTRRGHGDSEAAKRFLTPKLTGLHDPALLPGLDDAANRIARAVRDGQPIVVFGDYDVDGVTACAILWHVLTAAGAEVRCYIPHRINEGYGLNSQAIEQLAQPGNGGMTPLVVSVDCGITAIEPARVARDRGIELIITDHHELPLHDLPPASILVHPRLADSRYPFGYLCGAGVAFKLAWQFAKAHCGSSRVPAAFRDLLMDLLSLAALGTVADVVPLIDENRIMTAFGLGQIKRTRFAGLNAMIDAARLREEKINAFHVGFVLAPRLNAAGRMGHAQQALQLLTEADDAQARQISSFLASENERRRAAERAVFEQAHQMVIDAGHDRDDCRAILLGRENWHPGVLGIVAARLVDKFARPTILLNIENGEAHGSARSVESVPIHEVIGNCDDLLTSHGGHAMAAGVRLEATNLEEFRTRLTEQINAILEPEDLIHTIDVDDTCTIDQLDTPLVAQIERLAPFGRANPSPRLCLRRVRIDAPPQRVGREGSHLRLTLRQNNRSAKAIGFGLGDLADQLTAGMHLDLVVEPKLSRWQGRTSVDLHLKDLKRAEKA